MTTQQDVIKQFMASLDNTTLSGMDAFEEAVKACSKFGSLQEAIDQMIIDRKASTDNREFLLKYCGINLDNLDTGAITGFDAGGSDVIKTAESIIPESGEAVYPPSNTFTIRGLTVVVPEKETLTKAEQIVVKGLYSWWIDGALKLIEDSYGLSFTDPDKSGNTLYVSFSYDPETITLASASAHSLNINMAYYKSIVDGDTEGQNINGSNLTLDRVIAHELTHSIMEVAINDFYFLPDYIIESVAEMTHGTDDIRGEGIYGIVQKADLFARRFDTSKK